MKKLISLMLIIVMISAVIFSVPAHGRLNIDRIHVNANSLDSALDVKGDDPIEIEVGDKLYILGWAFGEYSNLREIVYSIDDGEDIACPGQYRDRADVAQAFGLDYSFGTNAGFGIDAGGMLELAGIDTLGNGTYVLHITAIYNDGERETKDYNLKVGTGINGERTFKQIDGSKLNIVIDGGTEAFYADPGDTVQVKIRLINNTTVSALKVQLKYDRRLSVVTDNKGKPKVTFDIFDPDDDSAMRASLLDAENRSLMLNWLSAESEVEGDTDYATVTFKVAADAERGAFLPINAQINPNDVFDIEQNNIDFNLISGGVDVATHNLGPVEYDANYHWYTCVDCGETVDRGRHTYGPVHLIKEATCEEPGEAEHTCTVCGYTENYRIEALGHKLTVAELKETVDGILNIVIDGGTEEIKAAPGEEIGVKIKLVNNTGISSLKIRLKFDEKLSVSVDDLGKAKVFFDIYDPDDPSVIRGYALADEHNVIVLNWLSSEGEVYGDTVYATVTFRVSDDADIGEFLDIDAEIDPEDVFDIDQTNIGFNLITGGVTVAESDGIEHDGFNHWVRCLRCGEAVNVEPHEFGADFVVSAPTCTEDGLMSHICGVCGYEETYSVPATGHTYAETRCDSTGHWSVCGVCGESYDFEAHSYGNEFLTKDATCTEDGEAGHTCSFCGYTEYYAVRATGHTPGDIEFDGAQHWHKCTVCGETLDIGDHTYGEERVNKAATCTEDGEAEHTCTVCGYVEKYVLPKLRHSLSEIRCDKDSHYCECTICGEKIGVEAHVDSDGDRICDVCGYVLTIIGDVNSDGVVNNKDVVALFRYLSTKSGDIDLIAADFNGDGDVNNKDVVALFRYLS